MLNHIFRSYYNALVEDMPISPRCAAHEVKLSGSTVYHIDTVRETHTIHLAQLYIQQHNMCT